jgi:hypothetical protein
VHPVLTCKSFFIFKLRSDFSARSHEHEHRYLAFYNGILDFIPGFRAALDELSYDDLKPYITVVS